VQEVSFSSAAKRTVRRAALLSNAKVTQFVREPNRLPNNTTQNTPNRIIFTMIKQESSASSDLDLQVEQG
jgi:hypothetical protein